MEEEKRFFDFDEEGLAAMIELADSTESEEVCAALEEASAKD